MDRLLSTTHMPLTRVHTEEPLLRASFEGRSKLVKEILRDEDEPLLIADTLGRTALHLSVATANRLVSSALLNHALSELQHQHERESRALNRSRFHLERTAGRCAGGLSVGDEWALDEQDRIDRLYHLRAERRHREVLSLRDRQGWTPLHYAAQAGGGILELLLHGGWGADLCAEASDGRRLFERGARYDPHTGAELPPRRSASETAARGVTLRKLLSARTEDSNATDASGCSPLHVAAAAGNVPEVKLLVRRGADRHALNMDDESPLDLARDRVTRRALMHLAEAVDEACSPQRRRRAAPRPAYLEGEEQKEPQDGDDDDVPRGGEGRRAAGRSMRLLLMCGEDPNERTGLRQSSSLHLAAAAGEDAVVRHLVEEAGALVGLPDADGWTALHHCAHRGTAAHRRVAETLISLGAHVDAKSSLGHTPLHTAAIGGADTEAGGLTTQRRYAADVLDAAERRAAAEATQAAMATLLVRSGASIDARDSDGCTPLLLAARHGFLRPAFALIDLGADLHAVNRWRWTALHLAAFEGHASMARMLAKLDAEPPFKLKFARNARGDRASEVCRDPSVRVAMETLWEQAFRGDLEGVRMQLRLAQSSYGGSGGAPRHRGRKKDALQRVADEDEAKSDDGGGDDARGGGGAGVASGVIIPWNPALLNEHSYLSGGTALHAAVRGAGLAAQRAERSHRARIRGLDGRDRFGRRRAAPVRESEEGALPPPRAELKHFELVVHFLLSREAQKISADDDLDSCVFVDAIDADGLTPLMLAAAIPESAAAASPL